MKSFIIQEMPKDMLFFFFWHFTDKTIRDKLMIDMKIISSCSSAGNI